MPYVVGVDVGGTFTDVCVVDTDSGQEYVAKATTTPEDLSLGLFEGLRLAAAELDRSLESLLAATIRFSHATTQTTNVMFTWTGGAVVGLLTTRGFADEILIMRARGRVAGLSLNERRHLRATGKPPQIVPRHRIGEIAERVDRRGRVVEPADARQIRRTVEDLLAEGAEAFAVSLLWSNQNPSHELAVREVITELAPGAHVSLSHEIAPITGEYERTSTTVVNAFVGPILERYLRQLEQQLAALGLSVPMLVFQAGGGVSDVATTLPVSTIESGPAAGMVAVEKLATAISRPNIIATDVGGTTFKVGLVTNGRRSMASESIINQYTLLSPMVDVVSIGAGGGSIAWCDGGRLRVGPQSAGASPGPACYGAGGTSPTVTDADVLLGYLAPARFLGGRLQLQPDLAAQAMRSEVADPLFDGDVAAAAAGVRRVVDSQMSDLVRKVTIERGYDPRDFVLMAYGGAGPAHAVAYARNLGVKQVIIPLSATAYSALGAATSDTVASVQRSVSVDIEDSEEELEQAYKALEATTIAGLEAQGVPAAAVHLTRWADMRYERQLHDVRVVLDGAGPVGTIGTRLTEAFAARYLVLYGKTAQLQQARAVVLRIGVEAVAASGVAVRESPTPPSRQREVAPESHRNVYWLEEHGWRRTAVHDGASLLPGDRVDGPAIVEQPGASIAIPTNATGTVAGTQNLIIDLESVGE